MGREIECHAHHDGEAGAGRALLESTELIFRGKIRFRIPFGEIRAISVRGDDLVVRTAAGLAVLTLGARSAAAWAEKIRHPPSLLDKLGLKPGLRIGLVGLTPEELPEPLAPREVTLVTGRALRECALILAAVNGPADLEKLPRWRAAISPDGGIWAIYRKGVRQFGEADVRAAARAHGLVDVKVAAFSTTHSALKLVIPKAARRAPGRD